MAEDFKGIPKVPFESTRQHDVVIPSDRAGVEKDETVSTDGKETRASIVVSEYDRAIEFYKFVEELLRSQLQVEVEVDPEDDPEVWMAMQRVFSNPNPKINQDSYYQVLDALEQINKLEAAEVMDFEADFLANLPKINEELLAANETEINDSDFIDEDIEDLEAGLLDDPEVARLSLQERRRQRLLRNRRTKGTLKSILQRK